MTMLEITYTSDDNDVTYDGGVRDNDNDDHDHDDDKKKNNKNKFGLYGAIPQQQYLCNTVHR